MPSDIIECCLGGEKTTVDPVLNTSIDIDPDEKNVDTNFNQKPKTPKKQFLARESILTELFETKQGASFYRVCVIFSLMAVFSSTVADFVANEPADIVNWQSVMWRNLKDIPMTIVLWLVMATLVMVEYGLVHFWERHRSKVPTSLRWLYDMFISIAYVVFALAFLSIPPIGIISLDLGPVCTISVLMELVRFAMKGYSCTRICTSKVLRGKGDLPNIGHFLYFISVPTGIYCDEYPRTDKRSWKAILRHILELIWCATIVSFIISHMHHPGLSKFRSIWLDSWPLLASFTSTVVPSGIVFILVFFGYFHCFFNIQAELTGFADRLFYKDWWTVRTYSEYFRTWNTIFQDWLFVHVYRDVRKFTDNRLYANIAVFVVSGIVHELVFGVIFRFFYPVTSIVFGIFGFALAFVPTFTLGNTGILTTFPLGAGVIITSYLSEHFSRINCPYPEGGPTAAEYFIPRSWTCPLTS